MVVLPPAPPPPPYKILDASLVMICRCIACKEFVDFYGCINFAPLLPHHSTILCRVFALGSTHLGTKSTARTSCQCSKLTERNTKSTVSTYASWRSCSSRTRPSTSTWSHFSSTSWQKQTVMAATFWATFQRRSIQRRTTTFHASSFFHSTWGEDMEGCLLTSATGERFWKLFFGG